MQGWPEDFWGKNPRTHHVCFDRDRWVCFSIFYFFWRLVGLRTGEPSGEGIAPATIFSDALADGDADAVEEWTSRLAGPCNASSIDESDRPSGPNESGVISIARRFIPNGEN